MTPPAEASAVSVTVVRTGGFAGLRRQWRVEPVADEAPRWIALVRECPWGQQHPDAATGADRFVWLIEVTLGEGDDRSTRLPESELQGPWRTLVDEVRAAGDTRSGR